MTAQPSDDDDPPPKQPPKFCPWCGGGVIKRWVPGKLHALNRIPSVTAVYVCLACKIAVRAFKFPERALFQTRRAARTEAQRTYDKLEASGFKTTYTRDLYQRGKCACIPGNCRLPSDPCPIHAPLPKAPR